MRLGELEPLGVGDKLFKDAGDSASLRNEEPVVFRANARGFLEPCAEDGRLGNLLLPGGEKDAGGSDGDQGLPSTSAESC